MSEQQSRMQQLLVAVENKTASRADCEELLQMFREDENNSMLRSLDQFHQVAHTEEIPYDAAYWEQSLLEILNIDKAETPYKAFATKRAPRFLWFKLTAAAAVLLAIAFYLYQNFTGKQPVPANTLTQKENYHIPPGKAGAILTLADGTTLMLDSMSDGMLEQSNTNISLKDNGLTYLPSNAIRNSTQAGTYNTLATPKGRQFNITLADGTRVWLNAASSIRFPVVFHAAERLIDITGEAFLEVAPNSKQPFLVRLNDKTTITVLGTSFNINAYSDESSIKTTLIDGAVRINNSRYSVVLKPGDQAQINYDDDSAIGVTNKVDLKQVTAWKEGAFVFNNADISEVMRQLARWYNVEVEYKGKVPVGTFSGKIGRDLSLVEVLEGLEETSVKFNIINENKIIVLP